MSSLYTPANPDRMPIVLSTLWIFAILNYLYADVMGHMDAAVLTTLLSGQVGSIRITPGFLFGAAVLMETAILMVPVSRLAPRAVSRWANVAVGGLHTAAVAGSVFVDGPPAAYYLLFGSIEVVCTIAIVILAIRWSAHTQEARGSDAQRPTDLSDPLARPIP
jgi:hypothetical protein